MKLRLLICVSFFSTVATFSQNQTRIGDSVPDGDSVESPVKLYKDEISKRNGKDNVFNNNMLDMFFAEKIGTAFGGANDLSLQKSYLSLNTTDESFTIGYNFDDRFGDVKRQLDFIFSGGFKFSASDNFSTIKDSKDGYDASKFGFVIKTSFIGNGIISYADKKRGKQVVSERRKIIEEYRKTVYDNAEKRVKKYNKEEHQANKKIISSLKDIKHELEDIDDKLLKQQNKIYKEMAEEEIKFLKENKLYRWLGTYWVSLDGFLPFGNEKYDILPITNNKPTNEELYNFNLSLSGNGFIEWSSGESVFLKLIYKIYGTNNIIMDELSTTEFQSGILNPDDTVSINPMVKAYDTNYDEFVQQSFKIEPAVFFFNNTIGISPSIEYNFSDRYKATNWKLGIPVSLKDKDGKPKVNFELQWKEVSTLSNVNHIIGVSTSFLFGDLIN